MTLSKFSVFDINIALCKYENKTKTPIYAIKYKRGTKEKETYIHNSISYTRQQALQIYKRLVLYLIKRYLQ